MKTQKSYADGADLAVRARGNGFYYAIRRFVGDAIEARRRRNVARHTADELAQLPDYLQQDINWPGIIKHEER
ncbi:hypothetical protein J2Y63_003336 [Shinella sp. BE166]|jgi:hypothetical protein|uniref:Transposase n=1 Tax=Shinella lacus TaxID=2654216 RepID=A0ABT1R2C3_9HYPH|nr:hypothetical protein [Shinella lacus]MCQ4629301.1 hypothetical protein [Shinella lacus]